jgi:hypothetical protein
MQMAMTQAEFTAVVEKAKGQGVELTGRAGLIDRMGVKARWGFDGAVLTVEVLEKPFFLSSEAAEEKLRAALSS